MSDPSPVTHNTSSSPDSPAPAASSGSSFAARGSLLHQMWSGALTNYLRLAIRLLKAVFLTRILLFNLGQDYYGFWTLLWTVFGYILLFELDLAKPCRNTLPSRLPPARRSVFPCCSGCFDQLSMHRCDNRPSDRSRAWLLPSLLKLPAGDHTYYQLTFLITGPAAPWSSRPALSRRF